VLRLSESADHDDDLVLVQRARSGDADAFRDLVRRYYPRLYDWALALTGDPDDADDVSQAALMRIHRGLSSYHGEGRFTTWLYPIVRSAAGELHRSRKRRAAIQEERSLNAEPAAAPRNDLEELDRSRLTELVLRCYKELPARQREIFSLADLHGYSAVEIAQTIGIEAVTVRTHLLRARRTIRSKILQQHPELVEGLRT
jgi:RNA polymerase sigma-70 factor (ECF subfamily)